MVKDFTVLDRGKLTGKENRRQLDSFAYDNGFNSKAVVAYARSIQPIQKTRAVAKNINETDLATRLHLFKLRKANNADTANFKIELANYMHPSFFNLLTKEDVEAAELYFKGAGEREKREVVMGINLNIFKRVYLSKISKRFNAGVKTSDLSSSVYIKNVRLSDHELPSKYGIKNTIYFEKNTSVFSALKSVVCELV